MTANGSAPANGSTPATAALTRSESDVQWLKNEHERFAGRAARLRRRGNVALAEVCEVRAARYLRLFNRLRLAERMG